MCPNGPEIKSGRHEGNNVCRLILLTLDRDIKHARESRHYFEKISGDLDIALQRNSQAPKSRPLETEETNNLLAATRTCFRHTALDHVHCITMLQAHKCQEIVSTVSCTT